MTKCAESDRINYEGIANLGLEQVEFAGDEIMEAARMLSRPNAIAPAGFIEREKVVDLAVVMVMNHAELQSGDDWENLLEEKDAKEFVTKVLDFLIEQDHLIGDKNNKVKFPDFHFDNPVDPEYPSHMQMLFKKEFDEETSKRLGIVRILEQLAIGLENEEHGVIFPGDFRAALRNLKDSPSLQRIGWSVDLKPPSWPNALLEH